MKHGSVVEAGMGPGILRGAGRRSVADRDSVDKGALGFRQVAREREREL